jgi:hypothetical protein
VARAAAAALRTTSRPCRYPVRSDIGRINHNVLRWREWEANQYHPAGLGRDLVAPTLSQEALEGLRAKLVEELGRLDGHGGA